MSWAAKLNWNRFVSMMCTCFALWSVCVGLVSAVCALRETEYHETRSLSILAIESLNIYTRVECFLAAGGIMAACYPSISFADSVNHLVGGTIAVLHMYFFSWYELSIGRLPQDNRQKSLRICCTTNPIDDCEKPQLNADCAARLHATAHKYVVCCPTVGSKKCLLPIVRCRNKLAWSSAYKVHKLLFRAIAPTRRLDLANKSVRRRKRTRDGVNGLYTERGRSNRWRNMYGNGKKKLF